MEGDLMNQRVLQFALLALVVALSGCGRTAPAPSSSDSRSRADHDDRTDRYAHRADDDRYAEGERAIKSTAQKAKQRIDDMANDAEEALHHPRNNASTKIRSQAQRAAELAAEALEEAKDRAEDLPDESDDVLQRQARRLRSDIDRLEEAVEGIRHDVDEVDAKNK
jgi:hypothetical protein